ncbi:hypothetical protein QN277_007878 [Acacia crassicarpa]|uniref:Timeless N-terminal domain-containing protein n=1 Tax=Acacia crassicarpa TaxID=499986 RepID=A0AAE1JVL6_9FABA|nr:hypothetical protein QN277_007878 [Acacia crassicarpa]
MEMEGLSLICAGLGVIEEDKNGNKIGYSKDEYCLDNLKDLLRFLRRDDPQTRDVFKQVCKWDIVSKDLIPIIEYCQEDRNLLLNAVKVLVFITMPMEPSLADISQQLEYLWKIKASITSSDIVAVIVSFLEGPLENLESDAFTEDDWKLVQLVLTLFRNILAVQEIPLHQKTGGSASQLLSLRNSFLELLFRENVMDIILVIINYSGGSSAFRQDNLLLVEILHYIFMGQGPELIVRAHLNGLKVDEDSQVSLNSLKSVMEEEAEKRRRCRLNVMIRHSQFSGTFARLTMDGSKAVFKGNPCSRNILHKSQNITRGPVKKIAWDHPKFLPTKEKILELLYGFVNQFLSRGYNTLMQSICEDVEKEHPAIQHSDVIVFFEVAEFVTSFQFYKYSASKMNNGINLETFDDKDTLGTDFNGQICGPIAATMNEAMFQLVISKWRHAFDSLKETNDYKFLSAAGSLMKNMIVMLDLVLKLLPEDSKEPQTARILLYKLFYDQTEEGMTHFLLNLIKTFDTHKQPKSDLADLVEIIHEVVKLLENLQARGKLRVSRKLRKVKKKKFQERIETGDKLCRDHSDAEDEVGDSGLNPLLLEKLLAEKEYAPNRSSGGEEDFIGPANDNQHEKIVQEEENVVGDSELKDIKNYEHANEGLLHDTGDFSNDEQQTEYNEVDFKVSTLVSAFANHNIIQKICWLLKFYKSNSLATNHHIISILQRICDDLELHPMLYQLSLLTTFYDILSEQKKSSSQKYANIVAFLTNLIRKMLKTMKKQPLLFVDILYWKTRRECHYVNAEYLLNELSHLKKESRNLDSTQVNGEIGSSADKLWTRRSIADALGDDEADVVITHDLGYQNGEKLIEDESGRASSPRKRLRLDGELERQIKDLFEEFKDDQHCCSRIAEVIDPDASTNHYEGEGTTNRNSNLGESLNSEQNPLGQHLQKRKRVHAFSEDQESLIRSLYEQFKDHRRCCYKIASALDMDGKFTSRQVSRKLKQLGLSLPQKNLKGNMHPRDEDLHDSSTDKADGSDDETLVSLIKRKTGRSLHKPMIDEPQTIEIQKTLMSNGSSNGGTNDILKSENWLGLSNTRVEYQQVVDELMDSEDEAAGALPNNAISRRKLRMIIDPEDDD